MSRLRLALVALVLVVLTAACRVDTTVDIVVDDDGSGTVTVAVSADAEAVDRLADDPTEIRLDDLEAAGWDVTGPDVAPDGSLTVAATKPFASAAQLPRVLAEVAGPDTLFRDVELAQDRGFARTTYTVTGTIDPDLDLEALGDEQIAALLGSPLGRPVEELVAEAGGDLGEALGFEVSLTLPDDIAVAGGAGLGGQGDDELVTVQGATATWVFDHGDPEIVLEATGTAEDLVPRLWAGAALVGVAVLVGLLLLRLVGRVVGIVRRPKGRSRRDQRRRQQRAARREEAANRPRDRMLRLLVVDVHGVVVRPTDPVEGLLLPLVREERPDIDPDLVRDRHRRLVLGRISPTEFWSELGLGPVADRVETRYLSSFKLVPGLHPFLDRMAAGSLPVAVVGNQPREWGDRLRRMAALEGRVASWLVSGEVGAALPEPALFEATRRRLSVDLFDCFYLSSVPEHLDAAAEVGMATGWFAPVGDEAAESPHSVVRGFEDLLRGA